MRRIVPIALATVFLAACSAEATAPLASGNLEARPPPGQRQTAPPSGAAGATSAPEPGQAPCNPTERAVVLRVIDGDTIVVDRGNGAEKVRYIGVDTPETVDPREPVQFMGEEASAANAALVEGREVLLERDVSELDRYGRLLRYVWVEDPSQPSGWLLVNLALVARGYAQVVTYPPDVLYVDLYTAAQEAARDAGLGLWRASAAPTKKPTPRPTKKPTPKPTKKPSSCHPSYSPCLPIVADLDCPEVRAMGKAPVRVIGPDEYRLDRDRDGVGCE